MNIVELNRESITALCLQHNVDRLYSFGSIDTDRFTNESDIDLLVSFGNVRLMNYFDNYIGMKESLERLFRRPVDLVESQTIKNPVLRRSIERNKTLIY
jgi:uncharacterized protein